MGEGEGRFELKVGEPSYPGRVAELHDPPSPLYVRGDTSVLHTPSLSIVGARRATPYGIALAEMAARVAAQSGLTVVSGGAIGCDQAAGWAAIKAGGRHVMVLGSGADTVYPPSARGLIVRTLETGGAVVSLEPWGTGPRPWAFPKRNRVIAGLSQALFVTEAGMPSGTFTTAEASMELGREVLAAPGSILSPESRGSNYLISVGACCIVDEDALEMAISRIFGTLRYVRGSAPGLPVTRGPEGRTLAMLAAAPMRVEDLARSLGIDELACMRTLGALEAGGSIERLLDGRISLTKSALLALTPLGQNG